MPIFIFFILLTCIYAATNITVDLKWKNAFQFAGFYMAKEKNFYKKYGLNVNLKEFNGNNKLCIKQKSPIWNRKFFFNIS